MRAATAATIGVPLASIVMRDNAPAREDLDDAAAKLDSARDDVDSSAGDRDLLGADYRVRRVH